MFVAQATPLASHHNKRKITPQEYKTAKLIYCQLVLKHYGSTNTQNNALIAHIIGTMIFELSTSYTLYVNTHETGKDPSHAVATLHTLLKEAAE